tara:strand:+ start:21534 stop:22133 length:600 start_codon:yes stop_codon:yes gene_type:complete
MSVIFPGNYVTHLNAYNNQGVLSIPGIEFYRLVGAAVIPATTAASVQTLTLKVLSPDMRGDDKPRADKNLVIPTGAAIYRTAISTVNLSAQGASDTLTVTGISPAAVLTASSNLFPAAGATTVFNGLGDAGGSASITRLASDTAVTAVTGASGLTVVEPKSGAEGESQSAVIVEVCFFMDGSAPDAGDVHLPYKVDAGA